MYTIRSLITSLEQTFPANVKHVTNTTMLVMINGRIIAKHLPKQGKPQATKAKRFDLYGVPGDPKGGRNTNMMTHLDLLEGTRVRLIRNISVEDGLYNGAMGTIMGFVYQGKGPETAEQYMPTNFSDLEDTEREIPIVLVQMDGDDDSFPSCSATIPRLVPFAGFTGAAIGNEYHRVQLPFLPAHARTGHSVQGMTAHDGVVVDCGSMFFAHWAVHWVAWRDASSVVHLVVAWAVKTAAWMVARWAVHSAMM